MVHLPAAQPFGSLNARTITGMAGHDRDGKLPKPITTDDGTTTEYTSEVTWTATGPDVGIPPEQYQDFDLSVGPFPAKGTMTFTVDQYYSDGSVVHWDQPTPSGGQEPEHPAPVLTLAAASFVELVGRAGSGLRDRGACRRRHRLAEHDRRPAA